MRHRPEVNVSKSDPGRNVGSSSFHQTSTTDPQLWALKREEGCAADVNTTPPNSAVWSQH